MKPVPPNIRFSTAAGQLRADPVEELHGASLAVTAAACGQLCVSGSALTRP